ncbi:UPF0149 family protein [Bermanella marisrubri]|uniref:YecA family protein n=1 Tax=Bermanella marisrubri TaxID=207949 RepID=Q1MZK1_9GAMM|nr:UPF0149 family protein [Bermanella marisrubri]EAT11410.1 hypothetical protein RED65_05822 [Oceanobacter sp. RED65] [Bermanella marisrubri]QIZ85592.1 UPF0149 family protein [Bermanella marisrubri]
MSNKISRFDLYANIGLAQGALTSPSALQGWLTGYVCSGARLSKKQWLEASAEYLGLPETWNDKSKLPVLGFYQDELRNIEGEDMDYQLLLPSDESDFTVRMQAFAEWAKGFLDGFGASGRIDESDLTEDVMEVLKHYDAFSYGIEDDDLDEDSERLFTELVEHARVTAMFMFYHFNQQQEPKLH